MRKKIAIFCITLVLFSSVLPLDCGAYSAKSYALVEMKTGRMLLGCNTNQRLPMASTTKIMTGLLACESGKFDTEFTISEEAIRVEGSSMGLLPGEKITLRDLTYGLLLESGNDAANAIAYCLEGSVPKFAEKMNQRAAELGLTNTHFANPSGLDNKEHYTTALDLARLGAYAMQNKEFAQIVSTYKTQITYNGSKNGRTLVNHNEMLKTYAGAIGIKTGYTKKSGRCLVTCAQRSGITVVAATLHGWEDWSDHRELLDYGFSVLKSQKLIPSGLELNENVVGGEQDTIRCVYNSDLTAGLKSGEISRVKMSVHLPRFIYAPVQKNQKIGEIVFTLDNKVLEKTDILAGQSVNLMKKPLSPFQKFKNKVFHIQNE